LGSDQELLSAPIIRDWLPEGHLALFLQDTVDVLDVTAFYGSHRADGHGRAAHGPRMMVGVLV
jgi:hypothetical protein